MADLETSASRFLHVFAGERLQAFSDAVYAIIATLMVREVWWIGWPLMEAT